MAAGRLAATEAASYPSDIKALLPFGDTTPLRAILGALRAADAIGRIIVVGPASLRAHAAQFADAWVDERSSGEENALSGLAQVRSERALLSASDLPFVQAHHVADFLSRIEPGVDLAYPIYERAEFLDVFPGGRSRFARVGSRYWTGGSMCLFNTALAQRQSHLIRKGFRARKNPLALASLFGAEIVVRFVLDRLTIADLEHRLSSVVGGKARAIRDAHPALAMDCDDAADIEYTHARLAAWWAHAQSRR